MILAPDSEEMVSLSVAVPERYWFNLRCDIVTLVMEHRAPQEFKYGSVRDCADLVPSLER